MDNTICFLILHYVNIKLTEKTVSSILHLDDASRCQIVIVDNASPNGSGKKLQNLYHNEQHVHVLLSSKNLGFSKGNNLGFAYIMEHFNPLFVISVNNDIEFRQRDFLPILEKVYREEKFWVAGPDIYNPYLAVHSSPMSLQLRSADEINNLVEQYKNYENVLKKTFSPVTFKAYMIAKYKNRGLVKRLFKLKRKLTGVKGIDHRLYNVVLQGSCLIFDRRYCQRYRELFPPCSFMYGEEDILARRCQLDLMKTVYIPELLVHHFHQGSSEFYKMTYPAYRKAMVKHQQAVEEGLEGYLMYLRNTV